MTSDPFTSPAAPATARFLCLASVLVVALASVAPAAGAERNVPEDRDGDGGLDYVLCGDFDGDGVHRPRDVQACNDALTDTGARHVEVAAEVFDIPDAGFIPPPLGLIRPSARTRISCQPGARIVGVDERYPPMDVSIVYVDEPDVTIGPDCELDGGFPEAYDCSIHPCPSGQTLMGIRAERGSTNLLIEDNYIHHVGHACIYVRDDRGRTIRRNHLSRCGGSWNASPTTARYPGVYVYNSDPASPTEDTLILENHVTGTIGFSLRRRGTSPDMINRDLTLSGNTVVDSQNADGSWSSCMLIGGVRGLYVGAHLCRNTSPIRLGPGAPDFWDGPACTRAEPAHGCWDPVHEVTFDGLVLENIRDAGQRGAIDLGAHADRVEYRNVEVSDVLDGACFYFGGRLRDFSAVDLGCTRAEAALRSAEFPMWWPGQHGSADALHVDGFSFSEIRGDDVLLFPRGLERSTFLNGRVTGFRHRFLKVGSEERLNFNTFDGIELDQLFPGHLGNALVGQLGPGGLVCDAARSGSFVTALDTAGGNCSEAGRAATLCHCDGSAWTPALGGPLEGGSAALELGAGVAVYNVVRALRVRTTLGNDGVRIDAASGVNPVDGLLLHGRQRVERRARVRGRRDRGPRRRRHRGRAGGRERRRL